MDNPRDTPAEQPAKAPVEEHASRTGRCVRDAPEFPTLPTSAAGFSKDDTVWGAFAIRSQNEPASDCRAALTSLVAAWRVMRDGSAGLAVPRFRGPRLLQARQRAELTQRELATLAVDATASDSDGRSSRRADAAKERARKIRTWESRIGAWERGVDTPSASYVPTLAQLLGVEPLTMFDIDPQSPPFTALRFAHGLTLQGLAGATGISYTSLHRMLRGVTHMPDGAAGKLAAVLSVTLEELRAALAREQDGAVRRSR